MKNLLLGLFLSAAPLFAQGAPPQTGALDAGPSRLASQTH